ncbi:hypothetical protein QQF64_016935 [Cirrhinus molitorella]|uniref:Uncharacterized protein n=1 Tax=Cirrhinus molitorella TaxID=172907 RepID=A0ABR3LP84_9TELE
MSIPASSPGRPVRAPCLSGCQLLKVNNMHKGAEVRLPDRLDRGGFSPKDRSCQGLRLACLLPAELRNPPVTVADITSSVGPAVVMA